ncbi:MAG TPA: M10 family metallopeptidase [Allosphingosinicella sp.]|uniref:M10 family metallopeptidase n=1 Tax=Allosphingosinicella sp. TaxID=2823234 RepID=UPI002EDA15F5
MPRPIISSVDVEGDLPTADEYNVFNYVNPDPDGNGIAYNGLPVFTPEQAAAQLGRSGALWEVGPRGTITYSFVDNQPTGFYRSRSQLVDAMFGPGLDEYVAGFSPFTAEQRAATREAIGLWDDLIAPRFVERNGNGADINLMNTTTGPGQAAAFQPFYSGGHGPGARQQGDVFVNNEQPTNDQLFYGGYGQTTLVHELGHAIGLSHPGDYDASDGPATYGEDAEYFQDSLQYTIMSYFNATNTGTVGWVNWYTGYAQTPQTPMIHDIAAVQAIYGADLTTRTGNTTYGFNSNAGRDVFDFTINKNPYVAIYDAGGHDTLDLSGWTVNSVLDLNEGGFSSGYGTPDVAALNARWGINGTQAFWNAVFAGQTSNPAFLSDNISIAFGTIIEDGRAGSGNDRLTGNQVANRLDAGAGNDILNGGAGNDILIGGAGQDRFIVSDTGGIDTILDFVSGTDRIDLRPFDTDPATAGDQGFTFIGNGAFTGGDEVRTYSEGGRNFLAGDLNGDRVADFVIDLGSATVVATDLLV